MKLRRVTPFLWYDGQALEAARFYCRIFERSKIHSSSPMSVTFELDGQMFYALNGGPNYKFTPAISLFVNCKDQKEVDDYWNRLLKGGKPSRCGWLEDKYGLSWQIVPQALGRCLNGKDRIGARHGSHDAHGEAGRGKARGRLPGRMTLAGQVRMTRHSRLPSPSQSRRPPRTLTPVPVPVVSPELSGEPLQCPS